MNSEQIIQDKINVGYKSGELSFTDVEINKLLSVCDNFDDEAFIRVALATCCRREDLANLKWVNFDQYNNKLVFNEKKKMMRPKTIFLGNAMVTFLQRYKKSLPPDRKYILKWRGRTLHDRLQKLCDKAGIPRRPVHVLRASGIKRYKNSGLDMDFLCAISGDTERTLREHYLCLRDEDMKKAIIEKEVF